MNDKRTIHKPHSVGLSCLIRPFVSEWIRNEYIKKHKPIHIPKALQRGDIELALKNLHKEKSDAK